MLVICVGTHLHVKLATGNLVISVILKHTTALTVVINHTRDVCYKGSLLSVTLMHTSMLTWARNRMFVISVLRYFVHPAISANTN